MATASLSFRCPDDLRAALQAAAKRKGIETGELIRQILGDALRVEVQPLPEGFAALDPEVAAEIRAKGGREAAKIRWPKKKAKKAARRKSNAA